MGNDHAQNLVDKKQERVMSLLNTSKATLDKWKDEIVKNNGGTSPDVFESDIRVQDGQKVAYQQVETLLKAALVPLKGTQAKPKTAESTESSLQTFGLILNGLTTSIDILMGSSTGKAQSRRGAYLGSTGFGLVRLFYYLQTFHAEASWMLSTKSTTVVAYGYAVTPVTEELSEIRIGQFCEELNITPEDRKKMAAMLYKQYLRTLTEEQLKQMKRKQDIIKQIDNPFGA